MSLYDSRNKEILLNIVRLRYDHPPTILNVGNISGSTKVETTGNVRGYAKWFTSPFSTENKAEAFAGMAYTDNPIISYSPLDDQDFHIRFLSPLSLARIKLLLDSSWSIARVFRLTLQRVGDASNASNATRPTSIHAPRYKNFEQMAYVFRRIQLGDGYRTTYIKNKQGEQLIFYFDKYTKLSAKERQILYNAGVKLHGNKVIFSSYHAPGATLVVSRSVLGVYNYLSKGVDVPPEDINNRIATMTYTSKGQVFNWQTVLAGMMHIHYCEKMPLNALVAVPYLGRWYYIDDRDANSKQSLMLIINIMSLISVPPPPSPVGLTRNT